MTTPAPPRFRRDRVTWGGYMALALFAFFLNLQGNVIPFLRDTFDLSYAVVSLHPAALAVGLIVCGLVGDRTLRAVGRRGGFALSVAGLVAGAVLFTLATTPVMTVAGCFLFGFPGGLVIVVVPALFADIHGPHRDTALTEGNGICYTASLAATLAMGAMVAASFDWRSGIVMGIVLAGLLVLTFFRTPIPDALPAPKTTAGKHRLPAVYWLYWISLFAGIALEQTTLLWAPEFLEKVQGLSRPTAVTMASAFSIGMLAGRFAATPLLRRVSAPALLLAAVLLTVPGFLLYWAAPIPALSVAGLLILALGIAPLYPLTLGVAIGSAGRLAQTASARASLASGTAILSVPVLLGTLADAVGLWAACLVLPAMTAVSLTALLLARRLERTSGVLAADVATAGTP
jgi:fucose permease